MKSFRIIYFFIIGISFYLECQSQTITVFRSDGVSVMVPSIIILKEYLNGNKTFTSDMHMGKWIKNADTLFLKYKYYISETKLLQNEPILYGGLDQQFIVRNDSIFDCTRYPEEEPLIIGRDTFKFDFSSSNIPYYFEIKYSRKPLVSFVSRIKYPMVSIFYPAKKDGFLILFGLSNFFEIFFQKLNQSLIGTWQSQSGILTLKPLYVQRFNQSGEIEVIKGPWEDRVVKLMSKGYNLFLFENDSILQQNDFFFDHKYERLKQIGFPPRRWEFERYY